MAVSAAFMRKLEGLQPELKEAFLALLDELDRSVKREDFLELKVVVQELAQGQKELVLAQSRTEKRLEELARAQGLTEKRLEELAQGQRDLVTAQSRTEKRLEELARAQGLTEKRLEELAQGQRDLVTAQSRTEKRLEELAEAQKQAQWEIAKLAQGLGRTREEVGGLSRSVAYALENEAYRNLPRFLKERHGLEIEERMIRTEMQGEEINLFGKARKDGREVILLGESMLRLDDMSKLRSVKRKLKLIQDCYAKEVVPIVVTHFAKEKILRRAQEAGFIVVQSFEW
jgi:plasmid maintenance system antidote protein VapI